jgi:hypothetical protein
MKAVQRGDVPFFNGPLWLLRPSELDLAEHLRGLIVHMTRWRGCWRGKRKTAKTVKSSTKFGVGEGEEEEDEHHKAECLKNGAQCRRNDLKTPGGCRNCPSMPWKIYRMLWRWVCSSMGGRRGVLQSERRAEEPFARCLARRTAIESFEALREEEDGLGGTAEEGEKVDWRVEGREEEVVGWKKLVRMAEGREGPACAASAV